MEVKATLRFTRGSAQKMRLVADQVRGVRAEEAVKILSFSQKRAALPIKKVLHSAIANAEHNEGADIDELKVKRIFVDEGPSFKRMHARARGRGASIIKPTCHITIIVSDN